MNVFLEQLREAIRAEIALAQAKYPGAQTERAVAADIAWERADKELDNFLDWRDVR